MENTQEILKIDHVTEDNLNQIFRNFSPKQTLSTLRLVSTTWNIIIEQSIYWKERGANSPEDFIARVKKMDHRLQKLVLGGIYTITLADEIERLWALPFEEVIKELKLSEDDIKALSKNPNLLSIKGGIQALKEGLLNAKDIQFFHFHIHQLVEIFTEEGLQALREKLFDVNDMQNLKLDSFYLAVLFSPEGIQAVREKLFDVKNIRCLELTALQLQGLFSEGGLHALREGLFNVTDIQAFQLSTFHLKELFSEGGLEALREEHFNVKDIQAFQLSAFHLKRLFSENGLKALREKLFDVKDISTFKLDHLEKLFSEGGLHALREGFDLKDIRRLNLDNFQLSVFLRNLEDPNKLMFFTYFLKSDELKAIKLFSKEFPESLSALTMDRLYDRLLKALIISDDGQKTLEMINACEDAKNSINETAFFGVAFGSKGKEIINAFMKLSKKADTYLSQQINLEESGIKIELTYK